VECIERFFGGDLKKIVPIFVRLVGALRYTGCTGVGKWSAIAEAEQGGGSRRNAISHMAVAA
jgi:hypothetical protein